MLGRLFHAHNLFANPLFKTVMNKYCSVLHLSLKKFSGMGMDLHKRSGESKTLALQFDAEGKLRHDAVARHGHAKDKVFLFLKNQNFLGLSRNIVIRSINYFLSFQNFNFLKPFQFFQIIYSRLSDMKAKMIDEEDDSFQKPNEEMVADKTEATRMALEKIIASKVFGIFVTQFLVFWYYENYLNY